MKETPLIFNGEMVRALFDERKTQTRRLVKPQPWPDPARVTYSGEDALWLPESNSGKIGIFHPPEYKCPYGEVGDRIWVREAWQYHPDQHPAEAEILYRATDPGWDDSDSGLRWRSPIHLFRKFSRATLEITGLRVERVQDISEGDAKAEGISDERCFGDWMGNYVLAFEELWNEINDNWDHNPWVWVIEFKKL